MGPIGYDMMFHIAFPKAGRRYLAQDARDRIYASERLLSHLCGDWMRKSPRLIKRSLL